MVSGNGYGGTKVVILAPTDNAVINACCNVAYDLLKKIGINSELVVMDSATMPAWPNDPKLQALRGDFLAAPTDTAMRAVAERIELAGRAGYAEVNEVLESSWAERKR